MWMHYNPGLFPWVKIQCNTNVEEKKKVANSYNSFIFAAFPYSQAVDISKSPAVASSTLFNNSAGAFCTIGWVTLACRRGGCCANRCLHQPWVNKNPCLGIILPQGDLLPPPLLFPPHHVEFSVLTLSLLHPPVSVQLILSANYQHIPPCYIMSSSFFCHINGGLICLQG